MTRKALVWFTLPFLLLFSSTAWALPDADLNCDGEVDIVDVQLSIIHALSIPMNPLLDANANTIPDSCEPIAPLVVCGPGTQLNEQGAVCVVSQSVLDQAFADGAASVDITSDNEEICVGGGGTFSDGGCVASLLEPPKLNGLDLSGMNLDGVILNNANLITTNLSNSNLTGAQFISSSFNAGDLHGATLNSANFTDAVLSAANLSNAIMNFTNFTDAFLNAANLTNATLFGANLTGALLASTNLTGANLHGANLTNATLVSVIWNNTTCPDGLNSNNMGGTCCNNTNGTEIPATCF